MIAFDVIVLPADDRLPCIVPLMTSPLASSASSASSALSALSVEPYRCGRIPHPEIYMDYVVEQLGSQAWRFHVGSIFVV